MTTFIAPESMRTAWSTPVPKALAREIAGSLTYAKAQKGVFHWELNGVETLFVALDEPARALPTKDGAIIAFGEAEPRGARWRAARGIAFPVTGGKMSVFSTEDAALGADFDLPTGTYDVAVGVGLVRLKRRAT